LSARAKAVTKSGIADYETEFPGTDRYSEAAHRQRYSAAGRFGEGVLIHERFRGSAIENGILGGAKNF
jgi:hypothetical protein